MEMLASRGQAMEINLKLSHVFIFKLLATSKLFAMRWQLFAALQKSADL
jgi:hypothetical protein